MGVHFAVKGVKKNELLFYICYALFFLALYIEDVSLLNVNTVLLAKCLKIGVMLCLIVQMFAIKWIEKKLYHLLAVSMIGGALLCASGDFFWIVVLLMGSVSYGIDKEKIYRLSLKCNILLTLIVLALFGLGLCEDVLSYRTDLDVHFRHSLGFVHSNILPLCVFYAFVYILLIYKNKTKKLAIVFWAALDGIVYWLCGSRNAFVGIFLLIVAYLLFRNADLHFVWKRIIQTAAKYSMIFMSVFSVLPSYLRSKGVLMPLWYLMDKVFTNRTLLGAAAIDSYGFHLLNRMSSEEYFNTNVIINSYSWNGVVLDNGYLYIAIRYGIAVLLLCLAIYRALQKQCADSILDCIVLVVVVLVNFTDNDLLSYGFLPMMVVGIQQVFNNIRHVKIRNRCEVKNAKQNQCSTKHLQ